jgi:uncharacterized protein
MMKRAQSFYKNYKFNFSEKELSMAAFMLHQTTERLYTAILLVFTRYKPKSHDLLVLRKFANTIDPELAMVFPLDNTENKHLFKLLRNAYVDARYKPGYVITEGELARLAEQVNKLKDMVENLCLAKIASFIQ